MQSLAIKRSREEEKGDEASEDELTLRRKVCANQASFGLIPIPSFQDANLQCRELNPYASDLYPSQRNPRASQPYLLLPRQQKTNGMIATQLSFGMARLYMPILFSPPVVTYIWRLIPT